MTDKKIKIEFAPGAFDQFEGTQEELDSLMAEITRMIQSGEMFENSKPVDIEELLESDDAEDHRLAEKLMQSFDGEEANRNLQ
jgi:hypothetical protein